MIISLKKNSRISVLGCGWFGLPFAKKLIDIGYLVKGSTTSAEKLAILAAAKIEPYLVDLSIDEQKDNSKFYDSDVLFICIPPKRNSPELEDYAKKIELAIRSTPINTQIVMVSSTSVYGDQNKIVDEDSETYPETDSGKVVLQAEHSLKNLKPNHHTIIRFAGLIGPDRDPARFFAGKKDIPNGLSPINMIHQKDAIGIACSIIEQSAFGRTYNGCAPNHPSKIKFYGSAAEKSGLEKPNFIEETTSYKTVSSKNVPKYLNYKFEYPL